MNPNPYTNIKISPFFVASCGCIGMHVGQDQWCVIKGCDREHDQNPLEVSAATRYYDDAKTFTPLTEEQTNALLIDIGRMVSVGFSFNKMARMVSWAGDVKLITDVVHKRGGKPELIVKK